MFSWQEPQVQVHGNFFQLPHRPIKRSVLHRFLIILRIYPVAAFKSVTTGINLSDITAQRHFFARSLLPFLYFFISKYFWKPWYLKADLVDGNFPVLVKDFAVVTFYISCLWRREFRKWSMSPLKVIDIVFLPSDSISACDLLLMVKAKATFAKIYLIKAFFKYHSLAYSVH